MAKKRKAQISDQLREAIDRADVTRYRISKETGIGQPMLSRFMQGTRSLSLESVDLICELLDLQLVPRKKPTRKKKG